MEWVETTGKTIEDAKEAALDQLGVDENDAEFEVLEEPKSGLFGRLRQEARVRARVRPTRPPPKQERRDRRGRTRKRRDRDEPAPAKRSDRPAERAKADTRRPSRSQPTSRPATRAEEDTPMNDDLSVEEQGAMVQSFLDGLVDAFGFEADATATVVDDEVIEARIEGGDLGLLIGPRGQTLSAVQELARTVVQRHSVGAKHGRINIDVSGYRERRRVALERFTREVAEEVRSTGESRSLEPMGAADRKIVHDTVNELDGVATTSEGEEPRRRVVIVPAGDD